MIQFLAGLMLSLVVGTAQAATTPVQTPNYGPLNAPNFAQMVIGAGVAVLPLGATDSRPVVQNGTTWRLTGPIQNGELKNPFITVNGVTCALGQACTVSAAASSMIVGSTTITSGTSGRIEFNNGGILGEKATTGTGNVVLATSPTIAGLTVTGSLTATGLVTNADLANPSTTVNGQVCTLGLTCTVTATASNTLTFGTHLVSGGTSYNGSTPVTITSDATSTATNSTIVARDGSGNFAASTITAALTGHASLDLAISGNLSDVANKTTARTNLSVPPHVPDNATLAASATTTYPSGVWRDDYSAGLGAAPLWYEPETGTCAANSRVNDGGSCVNVSGGNSFYAVFPVTGFDVLEWGAPHDGTTDATAAINAAGAYCASRGGGTIRASSYRFAVGASADVTIGAKCTIIGTYNPTLTTTANYTTGVSAFVLNPAHTINVCNGGRIESFQILNSSIVTPTDKRSSITAVSAFSGTGVTLSLCGTTRADYAQVKNVQILGFQYGVDMGIASPLLDNARIDATNCVRGGVLNSSFGSKDFAPFTNVECYPYLTFTTGGGAADPTTAVGTISGAADNGGGFVRITLSGAASPALVTGDTAVWQSAVGGFTGANNKCNVTVISPTVYDCLNIPSAPTATAAVTNGSPIVVLSAANMGVNYNQVVTDSTTGGNIPASTHVLAVTVPDFDTGVVYVLLDKAATGTGAADTLAFANGAYTSGGSSYLDSWYRAGTGMELGGAGVASSGYDLPTCVGCFVFDHAIGFDFSHFQLASFVNAEVDGVYVTADPTAIGLRFRHSTAKHNRFSGSYIANGHPVVCDADNDGDTRAWANVIDMVYMRQSLSPMVPLVEAMKGGCNVRTNTVVEHDTQFIMTMDAINQATYEGNLGATAFAWQTDFAAPGAYSKTVVKPGTTFSSGVAMTHGVYFQSGAAVAGGTTNFLGGTNSTGSGVVSFPIEQAGHFSNLFCSNSAAPAGAETQTLTLQTNVADSILACTITGAGRSCADTTHIVAEPTAHLRINAKSVASASAATSATQCEAMWQSP